MSVKTSDWRPGPTVCRCCLSEGCYKDISTEYFWMGKREVYAEMLLDTLNVTIAYSKSGPNSNSRLICEPCISRLRDAHDFKRQVLECEKTFMQHLDPGSSSVQKELEMTFEEVKVERVKKEKKLSDDEDMDDRVDFLVNDDSDDDLDDEPLMKLATKVPKKENSDLLDLLDNTQITVKRKSTPSTSKAKEPPAKKAKKREITIKPTASKATASKAVDKKKKVKYNPTRSNAEMLLRFTTAYPIRVRTQSIRCVYCPKLYADPDQFREHMDQEHTDFIYRLVFRKIPKTEFVKADLTNLRCKICSGILNDLDTAAVHLTSKHGHKMYPNANLGIMPYRLKKDTFNCAVCGKMEHSLMQLNRHTITHFTSYVCDHCASSYISFAGLMNHLREKHQQYEVWCNMCGKKFPNVDAKERHRRTEKTCFRYGCKVCGDRLHTWKLLQRHMESQHGIAQKQYHCGECNKDFPSDISYSRHYKLYHSDKLIICKHCGKRFESTYRLKRHLRSHK